MKLNIIIHNAEEGGYWAEIPALKGCVSEGDTMNELLINIKEAALGWLEVASEKYRMPFNINEAPRVMELEI
jgi:predicted RNase H-like HicB family nuclease